MSAIAEEEDNHSGAYVQVEEKGARGAGETHTQCRPVAVSVAKPNPTNNINYKKQHKNIEAQVHLTKGQKDRQRQRATKSDREKET